MCGLSGFLGGVPLRNDAASRLLAAMSQRLHHRGPDAGNVWYESESRIGLAHRRLAIVDLSEAGLQPMASPSGRYVLAFNGEIYNHINLRKELESFNISSISWRGHSDTEILLSCFEAWGIEKSLQKSTGMFAIAVWDRQQRELTLARDRFGEKPLYYGWQGLGEDRVFLFGSELKALRVHPAFRAGIDRGSLCLFLRHNYIPAPWSIHENIKKVPPGCTLTVSIAHQQAEPRAYWDPFQAVLNGIANPFEGSLEDASVELERRLRGAIRQQMVADVSLGAFLSGGIDSSLVVALMQVQSTRPVKTFTIGTHSSETDEAPHAKAVARHLGTDHTELYVTAEDAMSIIPKLASMYCEPFADSSQIPTYLVSHLAREQVAVSLSGDGGDEIFAGYNRYLAAPSVWRKLSRIPAFLRHRLSAVFYSASTTTWDLAGGLLPIGREFTGFGDKMHKTASVLSSNNFYEVFYGLVSNIRNPEQWVPHGVEHTTLLTSSQPSLLGVSDIERMMALDAVTYLPDDIMVKVDRAAMACSLETRAPFLDHNIFEFAWRLPINMKLCQGKSKRILREILYRHVPNSLIDRPKSGFSIPLANWLRGPLRDWADSLLDPARVSATGLLDPQLVSACWSEHISGRFNRTPQLWAVLMFMFWYEDFMSAANENTNDL
jgi:asparagine synthase (glutamine-hydrolysing)